MADNQSFFRSEAVDQLNDSGDLDKSLRVVTPRVWVVLVAIIALLAGIVSWAFFGAVSTTVSLKAINTDGALVCFVPASNTKKVAVGNPAQVDDHPATVNFISTVPLSRSEVKDIVENDYLVAVNTSEGWSFVDEVKLDGKNDLPMDVPLDAVITTERISPIELITSKEG